jgi:uncharacterized membrane protein YagU involved in acid resistance
MKGVPSLISPNRSAVLPFCHATTAPQHVCPARSLGWTSWDDATLYWYFDIVIVMVTLVLHGKFCELTSALLHRRGHSS